MVGCDGSPEEIVASLARPASKRTGFSPDRSRGNRLRASDGSLRWARFQGRRLDPSLAIGFAPNVPRIKTFRRGSSERFGLARPDWVRGASRESRRFIPDSAKHFLNTSLQLRVPTGQD